MKLKIIKNPLVNKYIDVEVFKEFCYGNADIMIGRNKATKKSSSVREEVIEASKLVCKANIDCGIKKYRDNIFAIIEDKPEEKAERKYIYAAKKINWLSTMCRQLTGKAFVKELVRSDNPEAVKEMVMAFEACLTNPEDLFN